jgi:hypothetical protein
MEKYARKVFCNDFVALFTDEDWERCEQSPVLFGLTEITRLLSGDVEPL